MARSLQIPVYATGTVAVAQSAGVWTVAGVGTNWISPDGTPGWTIAAGDRFICGGCEATISAVNSATSINLATWTGGAVAAGAAYQIYRYSGLPSSAAAGLVQQLLALGSTANPFGALAALVGSGKINFTSDANGDILVQVRSNASGQSDSNYVTAFTINPATGAVAPTGVLSAANLPAATTAALGGVKAGSTTTIASDGTLADAAGFRNRLRNAQFSINQRGASGTVTLAAGTYGHDGVKAGISGATYSFATSGIDTTLMVTAGSIILPIDSTMIEGGTYTLSQAGTAQARVWQGTGSTGSGSYASSPIVVTGLTAATQTNAEFSTGTVLRPQFEPGSAATIFERLPPSVELFRCQRYFRTSYPTGAAIGAANVGGGEEIIAFTTYDFFTPVIKIGTMRATPTLTIYDFQSGAVGTFWCPSTSAHIAASIGSSTNVTFIAYSAGYLTPNTACYFQWTASAEI